MCNEVVPFRPYSGGVVTRTRNFSEYMRVLAVCLVLYLHLKEITDDTITTHGKSGQYTSLTLGTVSSTTYFSIRPAIQSNSVL